MGSRCCLQAWLRFMLESIEGGHISIPPGPHPLHSHPVLHSPWPKADHFAMPLPLGNFRKSGHLGCHMVRPSWGSLSVTAALLCWAGGFAFVDEAINGVLYGPRTTPDDIFKGRVDPPSEFLPLYEAIARVRELQGD